MDHKKRVVAWPNDEGRRNSWRLQIAGPHAWRGTAAHKGSIASRWRWCTSSTCTYCCWQEASFPLARFLHEQTGICCRICRAQFRSSSCTSLSCTSSYQLFAAATTVKRSGEKVRLAKYHSSWSFLASRIPGSKMTTQKICPKESVVR